MNNPQFLLNVSVIISRKNEFLLIKRSEDEEVFPGYWGIPGGSVEHSDGSLEEAINRECLEEISVGIKDVRQITSNIVVHNDKSIVFIVYQAELLKGTLEPKDNTDAIEWKTLQQASELKLTPKTLDNLKLVSKIR